MAEPDLIWGGWQKPIDNLQKKLDKAEQHQLVGSKSRGIERVRQKLSHLSMTLNYIRENHPGLAAGEQSIAMSDAAVQKLIDGACQSGAGQTIKDSQRYLFSGLTRGVKELDWRLSAPAPIMSIQAAASMFSPNMAARLVDYDALNEQFMDSLSQNPDRHVPSMERDAGKLLFSLVFHSAVLSTRWFRRISAAVRAGIGTTDDQTWLELEEPLGESGEHIKKSGRRVFLAPVTQLLLKRWCLRWGKAWPDIEGEGRKSADERLLHDYVADLSRDGGLPLCKARDVFVLAEANLATVAPGFLVHYARTPDLGSSLPLANWLRIATSQVPVTPPGKGNASEVDSVAETQLINAGKIHDPGYPISDQRPRFKKLKHTMASFERQLEIVGSKSTTQGAKKGRKTLIDAQANASKAIDKLASASDSSVVLQLICHYARLLTRHEELALNHWREKIRNVALLKPLLDYATDIQSESSLEADEWQAIYESAIAANPGNSARLQVTLSDWHAFLQEFYGVERVALDGGPSYGVDAKIVTPREYHQAKQSLLKQADDEFASVMLALLILGYRCGLRRTEAWFRQLGDFQGLDDPTITFSELLVRPTKFAGVKSDSALRKLPLSILLSPDERIWLEGFLRDRKQRRHNDEPRVPLFADPVSGHFRITERMAFGGLTSLMRSVTGDHDFRFHHLRHSFATITLFRLLERHSFELLPVTWFPDEDEQQLSNKGQTPLWKQAGLGDACRGLALLTQWLGHSSERVALRSYTHLLDYLLGWYINDRINPRLSIDQQAQLLDKSPSALERFRHRNGLADRQTPAKRLAEVSRIPAKAQLDLPRMREAPEHIDVPSGSARQDVNPLLPYRLALQMQLRQSPPCHESEETVLHKVASQLNVEPHIAQQWHERSQALMNEKTVRGNCRFSLPPNPEAPARGFEVFTLIFRAPELNTYPCPPQSKSAFKGLMKAFKRLSIWVSEEPDAAREALFTVKRGIQRSHSEFRLYGIDNIPFMKLMKSLRLASCFNVEVRTLAENESQALSFWAHNLGVTKKSISVTLLDDQMMPPLGNVSLKLTKAGELNSPFWFWTSLRFLIFTGCVLYDAVDLIEEKMADKATS